MHRVALIYNPASGQNPGRRAARIAEAIDVLRGAGVQVEAIATTSPHSAGPQARQAIHQGCDTIIACGGDGTIHEVLQGMVGETAALSVIPMGTANALAADLGLPRSPVKAAKLLLQSMPARVSVGRVFFNNANGDADSRYFIVAAGVGVDAFFFSRLDSKLKQRFGYNLYAFEAFRMMATHDFPMFAASFTEAGKSGPRVEKLSQLLAVRINNFGGLVNRLVPDAAIHNSNLHVIAFKTRSRLRYLRFVVSVLLRRHTYEQVIELIDSVSVECRDLEGAGHQSFVEADGEWLGTLPVRIEVVPQCLNVLIPPAKPDRRFPL